MMKNECSIIRDLLPLYAENMLSCDTDEFVKEHLAGCEPCQKAYEEIKEPQMIQDLSAAAPLKTISRKLKKKRIQTIIVTALFVVTFLVCGYAFLDAPSFLPYSEELVTAEPCGDKGILLTFDEKVTDFSYTIDADDNGDFYYCEITAWTSILDKCFFDGNKKLSTIVTTEKTLPVNIEYVPNDETDNICIARYVPGKENRIEKYESSDGGTVVLPNFELTAYLMLSVINFIILAVVWLLIRKKPKARMVVERIALYTLAYIFATCIVSGFSLTTYSVVRDFFLIIILTILLYGGMLLIHNIWRLKKEIRKDKSRML